MNNIMRNFCLALYIFLFIKLCFNFVFSLSTYPLVTCDLTLVWGSALPDGRLMEHLVLMGGLKYTACLAWSCTQSVCALPS
jgi:hypothetical protein